MNDTYDTVFIRHAQSTFNQAIARVIHQLGIAHLTWYQYIENQQFNKLVSYNKNYIDSFLSEKGKNQCQHYKEQCDKIKPDLILVSPYRRTLQTCKRLFENQQAKVIVEPLLAQVFRYSCEVPQELHINMQNYSNFDFRKVMSLGNEWYLQNLTSDYQKIVKQKLKNANNHKDVQKILLKLLQTKQIHETPKMLRQRAANIKKLLRSYKKQYSKIVVIAHLQLLQCVRSKGFNQKDQIIQFQNTQNCHPYYQSLEDLEKII